MWRAVKIRTENLTEVPNGFLPLIQVPPMIPNKTEVLNLKTRKTQVPMGYLTQKYILKNILRPNNQYIRLLSAYQTPSFRLPHSHP
jgi:hypothetical protein